MFKKLEDVESRLKFLEQELQAPDVTDDRNKYASLMKDLSDIEPIVDAFRKYKKASGDLKLSKELLEKENDEEMRQLVKEDIQQLSTNVEEIEKQLKLLLLPKDPKDDKNIILEIRAGAGGDEASLFAEQLFSAYSHYASKYKWSVEIISVAYGNAGGFKEVIGSIKGDRVYSRLKYESGVHRVQRVPKTETQGRVHTSTVTVAVLPEAEAVDININAKDLRIDVFRSSGKGGQHVNTTDSAVRITHLPTNTVVSCQDEKSQLKNKDKAMKVLRSRLLAKEEEKAVQDASDARLAQIGTGDRSERIRTYNFPQSRVTDHRIGLTIHSLDAIMAGSLDDVIEPLNAYFQAEAMKASEN